MTRIETRPACRICGQRESWLGDHIVEAHALSVQAYLQAYPGSPLASVQIKDKVLANLPKESNLRHPPPRTNLTTNFGGVQATVHPDVPAQACLPLPAFYQIPQHGPLAADIAELAVYLHFHRSTFISGSQGTGKDASIHSWSALTRSPGLVFQIEPAADIQAWFFSHEMNKDGTFWQEGDLLRALRNGYRTSTGRVIPYIILITDFDRATKEQAESLRLVLDSISGRVKGPGGSTHNVLPGTTIVVTANTTGGGDVTGRYASANIIDSSIMDRFDRAIKFHMMDWRDEEAIVKAKYPLLVERCPSVFAQVGNATTAMRNAVAAEQIYADFSHRAVCSWLSAASDIIALQDSVPTNLLQRAFRVIADKMPDAQTATDALTIVGVHIKGGVH